MPRDAYAAYTGRPLSGKSGNPGRSQGKNSDEKVREKSGNFMKNYNSQGKKK